MERRESPLAHSTEYWFLEDNGQKSRLRLNLGAEVPRGQLNGLFRSRRCKAEFVDEITFFDPDGNHFGFAQFVPKGWGLVYVHTNDPNRMCVEYDKKWIVTPQLDSAKGIIGLLHEIGHAQLFANMAPEEFKRVGEAIRYAKMAAMMSVIEDELDDSWKDLDEKKIIWADQDRKAWAWAVRKARGIQRTYGVDLLFPWGKGSDVFDQIYDNLKGTELFSRFLPGGQVFTRRKR